MIDIHHHLLFGLDDGSPDLKTSICMAQAATTDGITHVVCTPHANDTYPYQPEANAAKLAELREVLEREGSALTLGIGSDFHPSYDNLEALKQTPSRYTINGKDYLLVELPDFGIPGDMSETFSEMQLAGLTPILTHPERNATLQSDMSRLMNWLRGGVLLQITSDSVTGRMGKTAERMSRELLEKRWVHFIASDAHNLDRRPPRMREARDLVAKKYGVEYADRLCIENPRAAFLGKPLGEQEEPLHLHDNLEPASWWKKIWKPKG